MSHLIKYKRKEWFARFGSSVHNRPLNRSTIDLLKRLAGTNEILAEQDIQQFYSPLAHIILNQFRQMQVAQPQQSLFILGISGSVAVGKSTGARLLTALFRREQQHVELITSDNFLKPNHQLEKEHLLNRKGFPESYDQKIIDSFVQDIKDNKPILSIPTYDHIAYTILPKAFQSIQRPTLLILEGVNVLQDNRFPLDYRLYFDAEEHHIKAWFIQRFLTFRNQAFRQPGAYFERFVQLTDEEATMIATQIWDTINLMNLKQHILPSKACADCVIHKNQNHKINYIQI